MNSYYFIKNKNALIITDIDVDIKDITIEEKNNLTLVFDLQNLSKVLIPNKVNDIIHEFNPINIVFKNSRVEKSSNPFLYTDNKNLELNELFISDELYSMSGHLDVLFPKFRTKKLTLKKFKINSKSQLDKFCKFICDVECNELILDDIFIELVIKENEEDETYNELEKFIGFENGAFYIFNNEDKEITKIKKLKMIDCPLFAITEETFNNIQNYKDISIDIDQMSLVNPSMITKFKFDNGYSNICFDLDSYKINEEDKDDYIECLNVLFNMIIDNNHIFNKLIFKNFDVTKYEYITGDNLTYIEEDKWILNDEEKEKKKQFEDFNKEINLIITNNIKILSKVKELVFDNCSNHFIKLILKFINSSHNSLDLLKLKKCGKDYFELKNIVNLNIQNLILFDTPLIIDRLYKGIEKDQVEDVLGIINVENLTIRINCLEHYCLANNLNYTKTIEILVQLINHKNIGKNLCFEMNALPIIMTYLAAKKICISEDFSIPTYFPFISQDFSKESEEGRRQIVNEGLQKRKDLIDKSFELEGFNSKTIVLKKNNIKNKLENYEELMKLYCKIKKQYDKVKDEKSDFGSDLFNLDIDYKRFFEINHIDTIIFENCLFTNYSNIRINNNFIQETFCNLLIESSTKKNYKFDMKTLNEIIFINKSVNDLSVLFKYLSFKNKQQITQEIFEYVKTLEQFLKNLNNIFGLIRLYIRDPTIIFKNIKEVKEFYCLLCVLRISQDKTYNEEIEFITNDPNKPLKYIFPKKEELENKIGPYFFKKKDEENKDVFSVFNYYYRSDEELKIFGDYDNMKKEFAIGKYMFNAEYQFNDPWDIIMK